MVIPVENLQSMYPFHINFGLVLKAVALFVLVFWTIIANTVNFKFICSNTCISLHSIKLVFIVLYKNPRLQTVPNLLVNYVEDFQVHIHIV